MILSQLVHTGFVLAKVCVTAALWAGAFVLGWWVGDVIQGMFA